MGKNIGKRIKLYRLKNRITQQEMADLINATTTLTTKCHHLTIGRWERSETYPGLIYSEALKKILK